MSTHPCIAFAMAAQMKALAAFRALLDIEGHQLHPLAFGGFLVCWYGHSRHCGDIEALEAFARQVGAIHDSPAERAASEGQVRPHIDQGMR